MKLLNTVSILLFLSSSLVSAQVGINTTNPQETLHVGGTVRIDNTSPTVTLQPQNFLVQTLLVR